MGYPTGGQDITLPEFQLPNKLEEELVSKGRKLLSAWRYSPYYVEPTKPKTVGVVADVERYSDKYRLDPAATRAPLSSVLLLKPSHFPRELLGGTKEPKGVGRGQGKLAKPSPWKSALGSESNGESFPVVSSGEHWAKADPS
eukprot:jgi/Mesvir1/446/Mv11324-RA.1